MDFYNRLTTYSLLAEYRKIDLPFTQYELAGKDSFNTVLKEIHNELYHNNKYTVKNNYLLNLYESQCYAFDDLLVPGCLYVLATNKVSNVYRYVKKCNLNYVFSHINGHYEISFTSTQLKLFNSVKKLTTFNRGDSTKLKNGFNRLTATQSTNKKS